MLDLDLEDPGRAVDDLDQLVDRVVLEAMATPKRSLSGVVNRPVRVVAPTSVKGGRSSVTVRAPAPWPSTIGSLRSSMAG